MERKDHVRLPAHPTFYPSYLLMCLLWPRSRRKKEKRTTAANKTLTLHLNDVFLQYWWLLESCNLTVSFS
jgi:hypothetical protein